MATAAAGGDRNRGRPRAGDSWLTPDRIFKTALELVDEEGLRALSMRRLGQELRVDPMSIYHHVPNKAAVVAGMVDLVFSQMWPPTPEDGGTGEEEWTGRVRGWAHAYHELTLRHPNLVLQIVTDPRAAERAAEIVDAPLRSALVAAGVPEEAIRTAGGVLVDYVNGFALAETGRPAETGQPEQRASARGGLDRGLDIVIFGLSALAAGERGPAMTARTTGTEHHRSDP